MSGKADEVNRGDRPSQWRRPKRWAAAAFLLALTASLVLLFAPLGMEVQTTAVPNPASSLSDGQSQSPATKVRYVSLVESDGWGVALPLAIPVVVAGSGLMASARRARRWLVVVAVLLGAWVVVSALSVGIYYLPAGAMMIVAAAKEGGS